MEWLSGVPQEHRFSGPTPEHQESGHHTNAEVPSQDEVDSGPEVQPAVLPSLPELGEDLLRPLTWHESRALPPELLRLRKTAQHRVASKRWNQQHPEIIRAANRRWEATHRTKSRQRDGHSVEPVLMEAIDYWCQQAIGTESTDLTLMTVSYIHSEVREFQRNSYRPRDRLWTLVANLLEVAPESTDSSVEAARRHHIAQLASHRTPLSPDQNERLAGHLLVGAKRKAESYQDGLPPIASWLSERMRLYEEARASLFGGGEQDVTWLDRDEALQLIGCSPRHLDRLNVKANKGELQLIRKRPLGKRHGWLYSLDSVRQLAADFKLGMFHLNAGRPRRWGRGDEVS